MRLSAQQPNFCYHHTTGSDTKQSHEEKKKGQVFVQQAAWDDLLVSNAAESRRACQKRIAKIVLPVKYFMV